MISQAAHSQFKASEKNKSLIIAAIIPAKK
jgi:hypothetical protein